MISVTPHARSREDRAGDPLDGLVNLFDLGIVLSVAFLLAALSSLHLGAAITSHGPARERRSDHLRPARADGGAAAEARRAHDRPRHRRPESSTGSPTDSSCTCSRRRRRAPPEWATSGISSAARSR